MESVSDRSRATQPMQPVELSSRAFGSGRTPASLMAMLVAVHPFSRDAYQPPHSRLSAGRDGAQLPALVERRRQGRAPLRSERVSDSGRTRSGLLSAAARSQDRKARPSARSAPRWLAADPECVGKTRCCRAVSPT